MNFHQFILIMRARWRLAGIIFGATVLVAVILAFVVPKKYTAISSIVVDAKIDPVLGGSGLSETIMGSYVNTQSDVVTSERVAQKVVKKLSLDKNPTLRDKWHDKTDGVGDIITWLAQYLLDAKRVVAA